MEKKGSITGLLLLQGALALFLVLVVALLFWLYPNQATQAGDWLSSRMEEENLWATPQADTAPALTAPLGELTVTSAFGQRDGEQHQGIDLDAQAGEPVYAALDGTVTTAATRKASRLVGSISYSRLLSTCTMMLVTRVSASTRASSMGR